MTEDVSDVNQVNSGMKQMHCFRVSEAMGRYDLWQETGIFIAGRLNAFIKDVFYPCQPGGKKDQRVVPFASRVSPVDAVDHTLDLVFR